MNNKHWGLVAGLIIISGFGGSAQTIFAQGEGPFFEPSDIEIHMLLQSIREMQKAQSVDPPSDIEISSLYTKSETLNAAVNILNSVEDFSTLTPHESEMIHNTVSDVINPNKYYFSQYDYSIELAAEAALTMADAREILDTVPVEDWSIGQHQTVKQVMSDLAAYHNAEDQRLEDYFDSLDDQRHHEVANTMIRDALIIGDRHKESMGYNDPASLASMKTSLEKGDLFILGPDYDPAIDYAKVNADGTVTYYVEGEQPSDPNRLPDITIVSEINPGSVESHMVDTNQDALEGFLEMVETIENAYEAYDTLEGYFEGISHDPSELTDKQVDDLFKLVSEVASSAREAREKVEMENQKMMDEIDLRITNELIASYKDPLGYDQDVSSSSDEDLDGPVDVTDAYPSHIKSKPDYLKNDQSVSLDLDSETKPMDAFSELQDGITTIKDKKKFFDKVDEKLELYEERVLTYVGLWIIAIEEVFDELFISGDPLVFSIDETSACTIRKEMGQDMYTHYWQLDLFNSGDGIIVNMDRNLCQGTYMVGIDFNKNGIIDKGNEILYTQAHHAFVMLMKADFYAGNKNIDGLVNADDPVWKLVKIVSFDAGQNMIYHTPESLGIESFSYDSRNIEVFRDDSYGPGTYADWAKVSDEHFRVKAYHPEGVTFTDGSTNPLFGVIMGPLEDCTIYQSKYQHAEYLTSQFVREIDGERVYGENPLHLYLDLIEFCEAHDAAQQDPDQYLSHLYGGVASVYHKMGFGEPEYYEKALEYYDIALEMSPDRSFYIVDYCVILGQMGKGASEECITAVENAVEERPDMTWFKQALHNLRYVY